MIAPKPKSVLELFDGHPERWTKYVYNKDANGSPYVSDNNAVCWCLSGAMIYIYGNNKRWELMEKHETNGFNFVCFNDNSKTTFEDVLNKVRELNI